MIFFCSQYYCSTFFTIVKKNYKKHKRQRTNSRVNGCYPYSRDHKLGRAPLLAEGARSCALERVPRIGVQPF